MDKYLSKSKAASAPQTLQPKRTTAPSSSRAARHHPYSQVTAPRRSLSNGLSKSSGGPNSRLTVSSRKLTHAILSTLKDPENPITHSKSYYKTEHIVACSSGHQVNDEGGRSSAYIKARNERLESQALERVEDTSITVFKGLVVYINGYCRGTTDTELKRLVVSGGGQISHTNHGGVTHIVTSMQLSASKTQRYKNTKARTLTHVVAPDWIKDCYG
ncbi:hypothetical protein FRC08_016399 [Ceratobasidium sp. 394]|nr:hypothetical protein FRC08_016399 [Ceratobasidium sp. 394]